MTTSKSLQVSQLQNELDFNANGGQVLVFRWSAAGLFDYNLGLHFDLLIWIKVSSDIDLTDSKARNYWSESLACNIRNFVGINMTKLAGKIYDHLFMWNTSYHKLVSQRTQAKSNIRSAYKESLVTQFQIHLNEKKIWNKWVSGNRPAAFKKKKRKRKQWTHHNKHSDWGGCPWKIVHLGKLEIKAF